ncbi:MAG: hypothetical protein HY000_30740 [Planctomycetes bacterium]|nr:hypothetical protein [Planctomycetota bacterium]
MRGVQYVVDEKGHPRAVLIDLKRHASLWEDLQDLMVCRQRRKEPRRTLAESNRGCASSGNSGDWLQHRVRKLSREGIEALRLP